MSGPYRHPRRSIPSIPSTVENSPITVCECGKAIHLSRKAAKTFRRVHHPAGGLNVYRCTYTGAWHLGHLPGPVIAGRMARADVRQAQR